ncbi:Fic family protein [Kordiimonas pumila]|uniref:Fic family protein n=1 Tax=Kordiimonas pumila TaxID=2161677 RepID=A0ABV7D5C5_9PROT|nr:Fic family protein [Kordiimonas pumila]
MFAPKYKITAEITNCLMDIEASRQAVSGMPVTLAVLNSLRESARLTSTHYSTQIEGNRLTQEQVADVIKGNSFPNRKRDESEVKNYYKALAYVDTLIENTETVLSEQNLKTIHGLVMDGRERPTKYRDGQNVIRNSSSGDIVYMPPEASDVTVLMQELVIWVNDQMQQSELPAPVIAGIAHYQFATIHPYYDGNGRTARLLTNLILHKSGYGLKGIYSLEEYYAKDLQSYYEALTVGPSHNYYMGRETSDITAWVAYFCRGMAEAFAAVRLKTAEAAKETSQTDQSYLLRELETRQKLILALFRESRFITTLEIAEALKLHRRTALNLCKQWVEDGFLVLHGTAKKSTKYELAAKWITLIQ